MWMCCLLSSIKKFTFNSILWKITKMTSKLSHTINTYHRIIIVPLALHKSRMKEFRENTNLWLIQKQTLIQPRLKMRQYSKTQKSFLKHASWLLHLPFFAVRERVLVSRDGDGLRDLKFCLGEGLRSDLLHSITSGPWEPIGSLILPDSVMSTILWPSHTQTTPTTVKHANVSETSFVPNSRALLFSSMPKKNYL
jgi:hypothetical protein